ncbi:MAG: polymerase subunit sigma-70, partial [Dehalococcoidia bacterium]|nr:polymerase subunit sigma-70 [Dehalococcoidia bacterium]
RRDAEGRYVPLTRQDVALWSQPLIEEAEEILAAASKAMKPGRFQLEAAIQSVHTQRAVTGHTDWEAIALLYEGLIRLAPTIGAQVGSAAALAEGRPSRRSRPRPSPATSPTGRSAPISSSASAGRPRPGRRTPARSD